MNWLSRRHLLFSAGVLAAPKLAQAGANRKNLLLLSNAEAESLRAEFENKGSQLQADAENLRKLAGKALQNGPWSVTYHRPPGLDLPPNEYFSEGPYWWPDPNNPTGPYIRRDGERNPDRFNHNHDDLGAVSTAVLTLGMGTYFLADKRYAEHAARLLSVWFVDPQTRMNPELEHGQAIRGINSGRGTGIIDTVSLIHAAQGIVLLEAAGHLSADLSSGVRAWFSDYLKWMTTSQKGLDEKKSGNNHATWWAAQAAAYAGLTGNRALQDEIWGLHRGYLTPREIQPDGSCPREEARTRSLSYSAYNLDAFSVLCRLAQVAGVDLWRFHTADGAGVAKAIDYLMPYVLHPSTWKKQQIAPFEADRIVFPALAAVGLQSRELMRTYLGMPRVNSAWVVLADMIARGVGQRFANSGDG